MYVCVSASVYVHVEGWRKKKNGSVNIGLVPASEPQGNSWSKWTPSCLLVMPSAGSGVAQARSWVSM